MKRTRSGFTLIELLVVVAIIAIISAAAVSLSSGLTMRSAITMTYATEKELTSLFGQYSLGHNGLMPDGFDSLMRDNWTTSGTFTTNASGQLLLPNRTSVTGYMYTGYDLNGDGKADTNAISKGVTITACLSGVQTITVAQLRAKDVTALNQVGITYVYDIAHDKDVDSTGNLTYIRRALQAGDPVMALDPTANGAPTYSVMNGGSTTNSLPTLYVVFGIGSKCTMIGDRRGGLQEVPVCSTIVTSTTDKPRPRTDYYNRYMVVIKVPESSLEKACFAGILDSQGWGVQASRQWYDRFPE